MSDGKIPADSGSDDSALATPGRFLVEVRNLLIPAGSNWNAARNEIQDVDLDTTTSGTFTLTFDGETTASIDAATTGPAEWTAALQALPSLAGNIVQVGGGAVYEFVGELAETAVPLITVDTSNLVNPGAAGVTRQQAGGPNTTHVVDTLRIPRRSTIVYSLLIELDGDPEQDSVSFGPPSALLTVGPGDIWRNTGGGGGYQTELGAEVESVALPAGDAAVPVVVKTSPVTAADITIVYARFALHLL